MLYVLSSGHETIYKYLLENFFYKYVSSPVWDKSPVENLIRFYNFKGDSTFIFVIGSLTFR